MRRANFLGSLDPEEETTTTLRNICDYFPVDKTALRPTRLESVATMSREVDISFITRAVLLIMRELSLITRLLTNRSDRAKFCSVFQQPVSGQPFTDTKLLTADSKKNISSYINPLKTKRRPLYIKDPVRTAL